MLHIWQRMQREGSSTLRWMLIRKHLIYRQRDMTIRKKRIVVENSEEFPQIIVAVSSGVGNRFWRIFLFTLKLNFGLAHISLAIARILEILEVWGILPQQLRACLLLMTVSSIELNVFFRSHQDSAA